MKRLKKISLFLFGLTILMLSLFTPNSAYAQDEFCCDYCYSSDYACCVFWEKSVNGVREVELICFSDMRLGTVISSE